MNPELVATLASGLFTGAALYINAVEHPARVSCGTAAALAEWRPSYKRAAVMQATLAIAAAGAGAVAWGIGGGVPWMLGALLMAAIIPFTLFVIFPTNSVLLSSAADEDLRLTEVLLVRWNRLHAARTGLSLAAFVLFASALGL